MKNSIVGWFDMAIDNVFQLSFCLQIPVRHLFLIKYFNFFSCFLFVLLAVVIISMGEFLVIEFLDCFVNNVVWKIIIYQKLFDAFELCRVGVPVRTNCVGSMKEVFNN